MLGMMNVLTDTFAAEVDLLCVNNMEWSPACRHRLLRPRNLPPGTAPSQSRRTTQANRQCSIQSIDREDGQIRVEDGSVELCEAVPASLPGAHVSQPLLAVVDSSRHSIPLLWRLPISFREQPWIHFESDWIDVSRHTHRHGDWNLMRSTLAKELQQARRGEQRHV